MRRFFAALLGLLIGYPVFAVAGYWAIGLFSQNHFDGSVEASMTAPSLGKSKPASGAVEGNKRLS